MNIMIFTPGYPPWRLGGEEYYSFYQANTLVGLGHNVCVIGENRRNGQSGIIRKSNHSLTIQLIRPPRMRRVFFRHLVTMFWYLLAAFRLKTKPDMVLGHDTTGPGLAAVVFGKLMNVPVIIIWHSSELIKLDTYTHFSMFGNLSRKLVSRLAQGIIVNSKLFKRLAVNIVGANLAYKFSVIPPGVDNEEFRPQMQTCIRDAYGLSDSLLVLSVGRLEDVKGFDLLIQTIPYVRRRFPQTKFIIVGDGTQKEYLVRLAKSLDVQDSLIFAGAVGRSKLPLFYAACDIFLVPSKAESFGLVFLEAWSCGKPVITTPNVPAIAELIRQRGGGIVSNRNPLNLAEALTVLLANKDVRMQMGKTGREIALDFSWKKLVEQSLFSYESLKTAR